MLRGPAGMKNVVGLLWDGINWEEFPRECVLTCMVQLQQQKFVFKLLKDVCSDFTDTNCTVISIVLLSVN